jgi:hypothetical protein
MWAPGLLSNKITFVTLTAQQKTTHTNNNNHNNNKQPLTSNEIKQSLTFELLDKNERKLSLKHAQQKQ